MLEVLRDASIKHNGKEIFVKQGQVVNVKLSFDVNDETAFGIENRYLAKFKNHFKRVEGSKDAAILKPENAHNAVEQRKRALAKEGIEEPIKPMKTGNPKIDEQLEPGEGKKKKKGKK